MNKQQKKEWLKEAWNLAATIEYCNMIIACPSVYSSPAFGERVQSGKVNPAEIKMAAHIAQTEKAVQERDVAIARLEKRKNAINRLKDGDQKKVLWLRYISHYSWQDICLSMNYCRSSCNYIHNAAVNSLKAE